MAPILGALFGHRPHQGYFTLPLSAPWAGAGGPPGMWEVPVHIDEQGPYPLPSPAPPAEVGKLLLALGEHEEGLYRAVSQRDSEGLAQLFEGGPWKVGGARDELAQALLGPG